MLGFCVGQSFENILSPAYFEKFDTKKTKIEKIGRRALLFSYTLAVRAPLIRFVTKHPIH
jgi:hypothetical protein